MVQKTDEVKKIEDEIATRYRDVLRLEAQLRQTRGDQFLLTTIRQQLIDQIVQVDGLLAREPASGTSSCTTPSLSE